MIMIPNCVVLINPRNIARSRIMQAACDVAFDYAHQRKAFGQRIGEYQV